MAKRVAVLMKLRDGVTKAEVRELCNLLRRIGDPKWLDRRKTDEEIVTRYDDDHDCDPVWYIP